MLLEAYLLFALFVDKGPPGADPAISVGLPVLVVLPHRFELLAVLCFLVLNTLLIIFQLYQGALHHLRSWHGDIPLQSFPGAMNLYSTLLVSMFLSAPLHIRALPCSCKRGMSAHLKCLFLMHSI